MCAAGRKCSHSHIDPKGLTHRANEQPKLLLLSMKDRKHSWATQIKHGTDFHHFWQTKLPNNLINGLFI